MRIISGKLKGRVFNPPANLPVRPTTDFAKTGLFNLLSNRIDLEEKAALDLFSGLGNITFELLSRGCNKVFSVEANKACVAFQKELARKWNVPALSVYHEDAFAFLRRNAQLSFPLIFADPPYDLDNVHSIPGMIFEYAWLDPKGLLIVEHDGRHDWRSHEAYLFTRNYGKVHFSFFENNQ